MAIEIRIPSIGVGMTHATLTEWLVSDGAEVEEGQPIYSIEMEKSATEVVSPAAGKIELRAEIGTEYEVGDLIAVIEN
jgi:pyruvate/2-oxoglutarate dehydrogenase complex dihydrolipoamide acyltransferase (E2) component